MNYDYINAEDEFSYTAYAKGIGIGYVLNINNLIFSYFLLGGSVIRMLEHFLTHSVFRRGLSIYLNKQSVFNF